MVIGHTLYLTLEKVFRAGFVFLSTILLANLLDSNLFGNLSFSKSILGLLSTFTYFGLSGLLVKKLVENELEIGQFLGTALGFKIVLAVLIYSSSLVWGKFYFESVDLFYLFSLMVLPVLFSFSDTVEFFFQASVNGRPLAISRFCSVALSLLYLILGIKFNVSALLLIAVFALESLLYCLIVFLFFGKQLGERIKLSFNFTTLKELLLPAIPLFISGFLGQANLKVDQLMIKEILGADEVANYAVCANILDPISFISVVLLAALFPFLLRESKRGFELEAFAKTLNIVTMISIFLALIFAIFPGDILNILYQGKYLASAGIMRVHSISILFLFWSSIYFKWVFVKEIYKFTLFTHGIGAIVNIILNYFLLDKYGVVGASYSTLISYFFSFSFLLLFNEKTRPLFVLQLKSLVYCFNLRGSYSWIKKLK